MAEAPIIAFKKRKISRALRRKTDDGEEESAVAGDDNVETEADAALRALEEVRELQKSRTRAAGVGLIGEEALADMAPSSHLNSKANGANSLGPQFQQAENKADINVHMQKYIQEQMALRRGKLVEEEAKPTAEKKDSFQQFYQLPEFLNKPKAPRGSGEDPDDMPVTDGWLVGIAEVNLSIDYKMKNIERTETERQQRANAPQRPFFANLPSNMGVNYQQHRRDYAIEMKAKFRDAHAHDDHQRPQQPANPNFVGGRGGHAGSGHHGGQGTGGGHRQSSDDRLVHSYIKRHGFK